MVGTARWTDPEIALCFQLRRSGMSVNDIVTALKGAFPRSGKDYSVTGVKYVFQTKTESGDADAIGHGHYVNSRPPSKTQHDSARISKTTPNVRAHKNSSAGNRKVYQQHGASQAMEVFASGGNSLQATLHYPQPLNNLTSAPTSSPHTMLGIAQKSYQGLVRQTGANEYTIDDEDSPEIRQASIPPRYNSIQQPHSSYDNAKFPYIDPATWARFQQNLAGNGQQLRNITGVNQNVGHGGTSHVSSTHGIMQPVIVPSMQHAGFGSASGLDLRQDPLGMPHDEAGFQLLKNSQPSHTQARRPPVHGLPKQNVPTFNWNNGATNPSIANGREVLQDAPDKTLANALDTYTSTPDYPPSNQYTPNNSDLHQLSHYQISNTAQQAPWMNVPGSFPAHSQTTYNNRQQRAPDTASSKTYHPAPRYVTPIEGHQVNVQSSRNAESFGSHQQTSQANQYISQEQTKHKTQNWEQYEQHMRDSLFQQQQNAFGYAKDSGAMAHVVNTQRPMQFSNNPQPQVRSSGGNASAFSRQPHTGGNDMHAQNFHQGEAMRLPGTPARTSSSACLPQGSGSTTTDPRQFNQGSTKSGKVSVSAPASHQSPVDVSRNNAAAPVNRHPRGDVKRVSSANASLHQIPAPSISTPQMISSNIGNAYQTPPIQKSDLGSSPTDPSPTSASPITASTTTPACTNNVNAGPFTLELYNPIFNELNLSMMQTGWTVKWRVKDTPPEAPLLTFQRTGPQPLVVKIFNPTFLEDLKLPAGDPNVPFHEVFDEPNASALATEAMTPTKAQASKPAMSLDLKDIDHVAGMMLEGCPQNAVEIPFPDMWKSSTSAPPPNLDPKGKTGSSIATPPTSSQPELTAQVISATQSAPVASPLIAKPVSRISSPKIMVDVPEVQASPTNTPQGSATSNSCSKADSAHLDIVASVPQGVQLTGFSKQANHIAYAASGSVDFSHTLVDKPTTQALSAAVSQINIVSASKEQSLNKPSTQIGAANTTCVSTYSTTTPADAAGPYHTSQGEEFQTPLSPQRLSVLKLHSNGRYSKRKREDGYVLPDTEQLRKRRKLATPCAPQSNVVLPSSPATAKGDASKCDLESVRSSGDAETYSDVPSSGRSSLGCMEIPAFPGMEDKPWPVPRKTMTDIEICEATTRIVEEEDRQKREERRIRNSANPDHICSIGCKTGACDCMTLWEKEWVDLEDVDSGKIKLPWIVEVQMWEPGEHPFEISESESGQVS